MVDKLQWQGPVFNISAINKQGTVKLTGQLMDYLEECWKSEKEQPELIHEEERLQADMQQEARERIEELRQINRQQRFASTDQGDDFDDDDYDVEIEYVP